MTVSKTVGTIAVWVRFPPCAPEYERECAMTKKEICITVNKNMLDRCYRGLELPAKFEKFAELSAGEIDERRQSIVSFLRQVQTKTGI